MEGRDLVDSYVKKVIMTEVEESEEEASMKKMCVDRHNVDDNNDVNNDGDGWKEQDIQSPPLYLNRSGKFKIDFVSFPEETFRPSMAFCQTIGSYSIFHAVINDLLALLHTTM